jgi:hypothetical protein
MARQLFEEVFNRVAIYDMLFFNVKTVLEHPTLKDLEVNDKALFERWMYLANTKYNANIVDDKYLETIYLNNAPYYPEYSKIVAITYAKLFPENGSLKRVFKKIANNNERLVIATFFDELYRVSSEGVQSTPQVLPTLCGYNITTYDIPLLIKRFILYRSEMENKQLPLILKNSILIKPWESGLLDVANVWKFNGVDVTPLMLISDFLELKKTTDLLPLPELSKYYWENIDEKPEETLEFLTLQSATQTNLVIQVINELRQL